MKKEDKKQKTLIGGQALMEGVMMQGANSLAMTVRTEDGDILTETKRLGGRKWYSKVPIIRGCVAFIKSLISGTTSLMRSSEVIYPEEDTPSKGAFVIASVIGVILAIGMFILLPSFISGLIFPVPTGLGVLWSSLTEGGLRIVIFIAYLLLVSRMRDIRRTFMYHGAEHRTINCYEKGLPLTVESVQSCSTRHNRCGTTFLFFVIVISILVFSFATWVFDVLGWANIGVFGKMGIRLLLLPLVAGLSYELLRLLALLPENKFTDIFRAPGLALQRLTTYPPDDDMAEIAIISFNLVKQMDEDLTIEPHNFGDFTMGELKALVKGRLVKAGVTEDAETDWIIATALGVKRGELSQIEKTNFEQYRKVTAILRKREKGIPLDYITGKSYFYGKELVISDAVLIPRIDTEFVADEAIKLIKQTQNATVLDLMTGSGCIARAIADETNAVVTASDKSEDALVIAEKNLDGKAKIVLSDAFEQIEGKFDFIVSNPPYIKTEVIQTLAPEVKCQPHIALDGGADGLDFYRLIAERAPEYLNDDGMLILEIGYDQAQEVSALLEKNFIDITIKSDYAGQDRVVIARKK